MGTLEQFNHAGQKFGRLTVVSFARRDKRSVFWLCTCTCGESCTVNRSNLRSGTTRSCGCLHREVLVASARAANTIHGESKPCTAEYKSWVSMIRRCYNKKSKSHKNYGGRGITVCKRWRESYSAFLADMGRKPTTGHTLERMDNSKGYSPRNCTWATLTEQNRNRRFNRLLTFRGVTKCISAWAEDIKISETAIRGRVNRGWPTERILTEAIQ